MAYNYFLLLSLLLNSNYLTNVAAQTSTSNVSVSLSNHEISNVRAKFKFTDLFTDVQYLILEQLEIEDLIFLADTGPTLSSLAVDVYRRKYRNKKMYIFSARDDWRNSVRQIESVEVGSKFLYFTYLEMILKMFKHFGHMIKDIKIINFNINSDKSAIISACINKYANESLTHLTISSCREATLKQFTTPFTNLEYLSVRTDIIEINKTILPFDYLFPQIRRIELELASKSNYSFMDCHLKHLEHLSVSIYREATQQLHQIEGMIRRNQQLQSIKFGTFPANFVNVIHQILPNLSNLTIKYLNISNENEMIYPHVKHFILTHLARDNPKSVAYLSFPKLETIKMIYESTSFNEWMYFFARHQNISKLYLEQNEYIHQMQVPLVDLTAHLQNLIDVTIRVQLYLNIDVINQFFEAHQHLRKFIYMRVNFQTEEEQQLRMRFEHDWDIEYKMIKIDEHNRDDRDDRDEACTGLIFERINSN